MAPQISDHFKTRQPSAIRLAQIEFSKREDKVQAINTAIGNVSLPMHPKLKERLFSLKADTSPFKEGVVKYSATRGMDETNQAFLNIIASSGFSTQGLYSQITDGGSAAMELAILGACGPAGSDKNPLLVIDAAYTNYTALAGRLGRKTISVSRHLEEHGKYTLPDMASIRAVIEEHNPGALVVIPYDNPTGHFYSQKDLVRLAQLCVEYDLWMISDEAYRELYYLDAETSSIWGLSEEQVPGISGRRISIETASKVWNACGLRIGALVTDNKMFHIQSVAEFTANLCPPSIAQYVFGALAHERHEALQQWYAQQRSYYKKLMVDFTEKMRTLLPGVIVSSPDASIYSVVDVRAIAQPGFDAQEFVLFCAQEGSVDIGGECLTVLVAPMAGFYCAKTNNPGTTQMRIAYVESPEKMALVPELFTALFKKFEKRRVS